MVYVDKYNLYNYYLINLVSVRELFYLFLFYL